MKLPASVSLLGHDIPISRAYLKNAFAEFYPNEMCIKIDTNCPEHLIWPSLLHEMVHAIFEISGLTNLWDIELEEAICRAMENLAPVLALKRVGK